MEKTAKYVANYNHHFNSAFSLAWFHFYLGHYFYALSKAVSFRNQPFISVGAEGDNSTGRREFWPLKNHILIFIMHCKHKLHDYDVSCLPHIIKLGSFLRSINSLMPSGLGFFSPLWWMHNQLKKYEKNI